MLAASTATRCQRGAQPAVCAAASPTAAVESARPASASAANGTTWASRARRPVTDQTQRRLSSNDGTVPTAVATTLAAAAPTPTTPTSRPNVTRLVVVATPETAA